VKISRNELRLKSDIKETLRAEQRRIDDEIKELRRVRRELGKIGKSVLRVGRTAYLLQAKQGATAAKSFRLAQTEAQTIAGRVLDMRGYCDLYSNLYNRHVDAWVTLGLHPLD
jgi:hypothetical protein